MTRKVAYKMMTETFLCSAALRKAQVEVAEFHRLQKLSDDLVGINEKICKLRPAQKPGEGWTEQEKKRLLQSIKRLRGK